jgi:hypothetical protein
MTLRPKSASRTACPSGSPVVRLPPRRIASFVMRMATMIAGDSIITRNAAANGS